MPVPGFGDRAAAGSGGPPVPGRRPGWLQVLASHRTRLIDVLNLVGVYPEKLDASAVGTHRIVVEVYQLIRVNVTAATAGKWQPRDQRLFQRTFEEVADRWTVYKPIWDELQDHFERKLSIAGPMRKLRVPRRRYIQALEPFVEQLSVALSGLARQ
jgi:hypothetical protein